MNPNKSKRFGSRTGGVNSFTKMLKLESKSVSRSCLHDNLTALIGAMRIPRSCKGLGGQTQLKNAFQTSPRRSRSVYLEVLQTDLKARLWCIQATFPPWFLKELNMCSSIYLFWKQRKFLHVKVGLFPRTGPSTDWDVTGILMNMSPQRLTGLMPSLFLSHSPDLPPWSLRLSSSFFKSSWSVISCAMLHLNLRKWSLREVNYFPRWL